MLAIQRSASLLYSLN